MPSVRWWTLCWVVITFLTLVDYQAYSDAHDKIVATWKKPELWWKMAIINSASMGKFSSDRSIMDYAKTIWNMA